jgi:hypothetical protein
MSTLTSLLDAKASKIIEQVSDFSRERATSSVTPEMKPRGASMPLLLQFAGVGVRV